MFLKIIGKDDQAISWPISQRILFLGFANNDFNKNKLRVSTEDFDLQIELLGSQDQLAILSQIAEAVKKYERGQVEDDEYEWVIG